MSDERVAAIAARLAAITPGPWRYQKAHWSPDGHWSDILADVGKVEGLVLAEVQNHDQLDDGKFRLGTANAAFIAAAPDDIAYLLDRVRQLEANHE